MKKTIFKSKETWIFYKFLNKKLDIIKGMFNKMKKFNNKSRYFTDELNKLGEWMKWFLLTVITLIIISQVSHMFLTYGG